VREDKFRRHSDSGSEMIHMEMAGPGRYDPDRRLMNLPFRLSGASVYLSTAQLSVQGEWDLNGTLVWKARGGANGLGSGGGANKTAAMKLIRDLVRRDGVLVRGAGQKELYQGTPIPANVGKSESDPFPAVAIPLSPVVARRLADRPGAFHGRVELISHDALSAEVPLREQSTNRKGRWYAVSELKIGPVTEEFRRHRSSREVLGNKSLLSLVVTQRWTDGMAFHSEWEYYLRALTSYALLNPKTGEIILDDPGVRQILATTGLNHINVVSVRLGFAASAVADWVKDGMLVVVGYSGAQVVTRTIDADPFTFTYGKLSSNGLR